jgi:GTPase Era involved in 16S rRNA processing
MHDPDTNPLRVIVHNKLKVITILFSSLTDCEEGSAKVGVVEMTQEPTPYPHPSNSNIIFWDVPGIGVPRYPNIEKYCKKIDLQFYDAFLIVGHKRFTAFDLQLVAKAKSIKKPFFFIRSHIDSDLDNERKSREGGGQEFNEEQKLAVVEQIRDNCFTNLQSLSTKKNDMKRNDIFLIDSYSREEWDFNRLVAGITEALPERIRVCFTLSLTILTRECLKRKAKLLRGKIHVSSN